MAFPSDASSPSEAPRPRVVTKASAGPNAGVAPTPSLAPPTWPPRVMLGAAMCLLLVPLSALPRPLEAYHWLSLWPYLCVPLLANWVAAGVHLVKQWPRRQGWPRWRLVLAPLQALAMTAFVFLLLAGEAVQRSYAVTHFLHSERQGHASWSGSLKELIAANPPRTPADAQAFTVALKALGARSPLGAQVLQAWGLQAQVLPFPPELLKDIGDPLRLPFAQHSFGPYPAASEGWRNQGPTHPLQAGAVSYHRWPQQGRAALALAWRLGLGLQVEALVLFFELDEAPSGAPQLSWLGGHQKGLGGANMKAWDKPPF